MATNRTESEFDEQIEDMILAVQHYYPRIYHACHCDHIRARSSATRLSARDATILAHLSATTYSSPSRLARHLNVSKATLSEALAKLVELKYVTTKIDENDTRRQHLKLSLRGLKALSESSVLDYQKLKTLLLRLDEEQRQRAVEGLALLAIATEAMAN